MAKDHPFLRDLFIDVSKNQNVCVFTRKSPTEVAEKIFSWFGPNVEHILSDRDALLRNGAFVLVRPIRPKMLSAEDPNYVYRVAPDDF